MRFRSLPAATGQTSTFRRRHTSPRGVMLPLSKGLLNTTLLGTTLVAGAIVAGPLYAAPTLGSDINGPQVQILSPSYQDILKGKYRILVAIKATAYNPASIEMFVDDRPATSGPIPLSSFPSSSFDWDTRSFSDGPHKLTVRVTDTQGFRGWAEVNVFINNNRVVDTLPPTLDWKNLQNYSTLSGTSQVQLQAADNFGVKWIYVSVNPTTGAEESGVEKKQPMRSWMLNRPPYVVDFDTTKVPDGLYKITAKAFDSNDQQGDAKSLTVGVVNNAINATTVGGLLDGLRVSEEAAEKPATVQTNATASKAAAYAEALPAQENTSTNPLSGTRLGNSSNKTTTSKTAAVKAPKTVVAAPKVAPVAKPSVAKVTPQAPKTVVAKVTPEATAEATTPLVQGSLSVRQSQDLAASTLAPVTAETPNSWSNRLARAEAPVPGTRALAEGQLSTHTAADATLLARSDVKPLAASADETQNPQLARLSAPASQARSLDEPTLSQPFNRSRVALSSVISSNEVTPAAALAANAEENSPVLETSVPAVSQQSKVYSPNTRTAPVTVGVKPMPLQRAAAAFQAAKEKVASRITGKATYPQLAALPRTDRNAATRSAITPAITVAPLEATEHVSIPTAYRVDRDTTLAAIANRYKLPVALVAACNGLEGNVRVTKGMKIQLPRPLQVTYAGKLVNSDVASLMVGDTSTTAFRFLFEQAGGTLNWDAKNHRVIARKGENQIVLTIGSKTAQVNDREVMMELAAFLFEGRTMVPVRFFEEGLNAQVQWDPQTGRLVVAMAS